MSVSLYRSPYCPDGIKMDSISIARFKEIYLVILLHFQKKKKNKKHEQEWDPHCSNCLLMYLVVFVVVVIVAASGFCCFGPYWLYKINNLPWHLMNKENKNIDLKRNSGHTHNTRSITLMMEKEENINVK